METNDVTNTTIQKKKVLVFDTSKGYSRLIYRFFGNSFDIKQCASAKNLYAYDKVDFDCALVIINHNEDVLNLSYIHSKVDTVFLRLVPVCQPPTRPSTMPKTFFPCLTSIPVRPEG